MSFWVDIQNSGIGKWAHAAGGGAPSAGQYTTDNAAPASTTSLNLHLNSEDGLSLDDIISGLLTDDLLVFRAPELVQAGGLAQVFRVSGAITDQTTYYTIPVEHRASLGTQYGDGLGSFSLTVVRQYGGAGLTPDSVATVHIQDDAVTAVKLAPSTAALLNVNFFQDFDIGGSAVGDVPQYEDIGGGTPGLPTVDGSQLTGVVAQIPVGVLADVLPGGSKDPGTEGDWHYSADVQTLHYRDAAGWETAGSGTHGGLSGILGNGALHISSAEQAQIPSADEKAALAGTDGTPADGNRYVTDSDSRLDTPRVDGLVADSGPLTGAGSLDDAVTGAPFTSGLPGGVPVYENDGGGGPRLPAADGSQLTSLPVEINPSADPPNETPGTPGKLWISTVVPHVIYRDNGTAIVATGNPVDDVTIGLNVSDEAEVKDDAITLAKLAHGTADKFLGFSATGVPEEKDAPGGSGNNIALAEYTFGGTGTAGAAEFTANTATISLLTTLNFHITPSAGGGSGDFEIALTKIKNGDIIVLQSTSDPSGNLVHFSVSTSTDNGTYYTFTGTDVGQAGTTLSGDYSVQIVSGPTIAEVFYKSGTGSTFTSASYTALYTRIGSSDWPAGDYLATFTADLSHSSAGATTDFRLEKDFSSDFGNTEQTVTLATADDATSISTQGIVTLATDSAIRIVFKTSTATATVGGWNFTMHRITPNELP